MRCMIVIKATADSEAGVIPDRQLLTEMGRYNEELVKAGILLAGEGLHPSARARRVCFQGSRRRVVDGPFASNPELIAGFWLWQVRSMEEAVEWVKRCPNPQGMHSEIDIRPVMEADDFGEALTPQLRKQEDHLRSLSVTRQ